MIMKCFQVYGIHLFDQIVLNILIIVLRTNLGRLWIKPYDIPSGLEARLVPLVRTLYHSYQLDLLVEVYLFILKWVNGDYKMQV